MPPQWYRWQFEQDRFGDPNYMRIVELSACDYSPTDFLFLPIAKDITTPPRDTVGSGDPGPAYRERIARHRGYVAMCRACDHDATPEEQLEIFNHFRSLNL